MWLPPDRIHRFIHYMKRMGSENDKTCNGVWNETERYLDSHNHKSLKRQKSPPKSFVWTDELKRQFTYTLKPSKCSSTDLSKCKIGNGDAEGCVRDSAPPETDKAKQKAKFFPDTSIENIFLNSEYFKLKSGNSVSFCSGENGENRWRIDAKAATPDHANRENAKTKKINPVKNSDLLTQAQELKYLKDNMDALLSEIKNLNRDFGSVRMDLKTIEKLLRLQKQVFAKSKENKKEKAAAETGVNLKLGKFSEEMEKAAQELRDFIDDNWTLLVEDVPEPPDLDKIISNLHRLSETAYQPKIIQTSKGAKFEAPRELPISLYADGILLRNKEFRKFTDIKAGLFLRDIEDGFFPSELWPEFPYGVPFQVTDRRFEMFNDGKLECLNRFPGNGRRLGTVFDGKPSKMVYLQPAKPVGVEGFGESEKKRLNTRVKRAQEPQVSDFPVKSNFVQEYKTQPETKNTKVPGEVPKLMSLKLRIGMGDEGVLRVNVMSNERMSKFQDTLFAKLCERYHDEYVKKIDFDVENKYAETVPDFEIHVYGRKPFRLSENLNLLPSECGIVDNVVINVTEI